MARGAHPPPARCYLSCKFFKHCEFIHNARVAHRMLTHKPKIRSKRALSARLQI